MSNDDSSSTISEPGGGGSIIQLVETPHNSHDTGFSSDADPQLTDNTSSSQIPSTIPNSNGPQWAQETPKNHVLGPNAFADTFAILMLLLQFPTWLTIIIHTLFIFTLSPAFSWRDVTRPFRFSPLVNLFGSFIYISPATSNPSSSSAPAPAVSSGPQSSPSSFKTSNPTKNQPSFFKVLAIDFLCAITTLYLTPILRKVVLVFAHAIVASSLGGGQRTFLHAIYATSIVETVSFFWDIICEFFHLEHTYSDFVTSTGPRLLRYNIPQHLGQPAITSSAPFSVIIDDSTQSFNTLTSVLMFFPTIFRFICHIDWYSEFPSLLVQMAAVYVIWLGLSPFLRGELASSFSSDTGPLPEQNLSGIPPNGQSTAPPLNGAASISTTATGSSVPLNSVPLSNVGTQDYPVESFDDTINFCTTYAEDGVRSIVVISVPKEAASHSTNNSEDLSGLGNNNLNFLYGSQGKRNKKSSLVRTNQPLWSMLASSIVMAARQEHMPNASPQPHHTLDAVIRDSQAGDVKAVPSGCFASYVFEKVVGFFVTGVFIASPDSFIVRVNQVQWRQTVIKLVNVADDSINVKPDEPIEDTSSTVIDVSKDAEPATTFNTIFITVHGLTGGTVYDMEIIRLQSSEEVVIGRTKVCTAPTEANSKQPIAPPSRPLSPVTTLLDTLSQSQVTLSEVKNSMKRSRKDHAKKMNTIRNEMEQIRAKSENNDKTDERVRRKLLSFRSTVKQLESDIKAAELEAKHLEQETKEYANGYASQKQEWKEQMDVLEERKKAEKLAKEKMAAKLASIESEKALAISKQEKLVFKKERLTSDISKIESDLDQAIEEELARRKGAREGKMERRKKLVDEFSSAITQMENGVNELKSRTHNIWVSYQMHQVPSGTGHLEVPGDHRGRNDSFSDLKASHSLETAAFDFSLPNNSSQAPGSFSNGFFSGTPNAGTLGDVQTGTAILPTDLSSSSALSQDKRLSVGSSS